MIYELARIRKETVVALLRNYPRPCVVGLRNLSSDIDVQAEKQREQTTVPLDQRFSNCGPRTTSGSRDMPLWSFKKGRRKNQIQMNCVSHYS
jgi:hypothetical protein